MKSHVIKYKTHVKRLNRANPQVTQLWVTCKKITKEELGKCLTFFPNLEELSVSQTELAELPEELFAIEQLTKLSLRHNRITTLPQDLSCLKYLKSLYVAGEPLSEISPEIFGLPLEVLELSESGLASLPEGFSKLSQLKSLSLSENRIRELPEDWAHRFASSIESISLSGNPFVHLPLRENFKRLARLDACGNRRLAAWQDEKAAFPFLEALYLDRGNLESLNFRANYPSLRTLSANANSLQEFPEGITNAPQLQFLDLTDNPFTAIPDEVEGLQGLRHFKFDDHKVTECPESLKRPEGGREEVFDSQSDREIPLSAFQNPNAQTLALNGLQNPVLPENIPEDCPIFRVEMKNCGLTELPKNLHKLKKLLMLHLEGNRFTRIPEGLSECKKLIYLHMDDNRLEGFSAAGALPSLTRLSIGGNPCAADATGFLLRRPIGVDGFDWSAVNAPRKDFVRFAAALAKAPIGEEEKNDLLLFAKDRQDLYIPSLTEQEQIRNLCIRFQALEDENRKRLLEKEEESLHARPLDERACVFVAGKTAAKKTEIKALCAELGAAYAPKHSERVTHVILGSVPKEMLGRPEGQVVYLSESAFVEQTKKGKTLFIREAAPAVRQNVWQLLESAQEPNVRLAVGMLQEGGVPESMHYPLLFLYKTQFALPFFRDFLRKELPEALQGVVKSRASIGWADLSNDFGGKLSAGQLRDYGSEKESDIAKKLAKNETQWTEDFCLWYGLAYYKKRERGLRYLMTRVEKGHPYRLEAIELLRNGKTLDWAKAYGYDGDWWREGQRSRNLPIPMPTEIEDKEAIEEMSLHYCRLHELPAEIEQFTGLKKLDLSKNGLKDLPVRLVDLRRLEELDLTENAFSKFPRVLLEMPSLRMVRLGKQAPELPDEVKEKLPNCVFE